jgi:diguanylate cyclase (GGDEF)-like protein/PAS domain S-box-containing protein
VTPSIRQLGGYEPEELIGRSANLLIAPADVAAVRQEHLATIADAGLTRSFDYRAIMRDGSERWFETHSRAIVDDEGRVDGVLSVIRDVSVRKATEAKLTAAALTDRLTGIPNRRAFCAAAGMHLLPNLSIASIAIIDIDHFKQVNDSFGHDAGDEVLRCFSAIAQSMMRRGDMVARLGGEEFGLLLIDASSSDAIAICERLRQEVADAVTITAAGPIRITISGGVAELGAAGLDAALKIADEALYRAKSAGRDRMALAA